MIDNADWLGLSEQHLVECQHGHKLVKDACLAFKKMQKSAEKAGVDIQLVSSFRSFERQKAIWNQKWQGHRALFSLDGHPLDISKMTELEKLHAILTFSALPGTSRHHWGTDCDVYDQQQVNALQHKFELVNAEYRQGGPCYALHCWLEKNAGLYGFYRPYAQYRGGVAAEEWHLSYRPNAKLMREKFNLNALKETIMAADVMGKSCIVENLEEIVERYVLNEG
jgi:LAS superfamily LD-carboxypeptidase LdcB